ncbi:uncharacterized protein Tco025E_08989 [Trypanosoma conorhini]|uniref:Uncharacterized protein n=1 Tax=Trypanosoma conorhini TaxID=83891 RepID=A0A3S5IQI7_9TRYP|nr:uncharacterized protein Tco025E_08989 [Trypanosoma conorhini]RNF00479.1 hypothetical protein Tco025E_08989 [Trypanosoma conorhini]
MTTLYYSLCRALLRHKFLYNDVLIPIFGTLHPYGLKQILLKYQCLFPYVVDPSDGNLLRLEQSIQKAVSSGEHPSLAFTALEWLSFLDRRLSYLTTDALHNANYRFSLGEIAQVNGSHDRVVIAIRFPVLMTEMSADETDMLGAIDKPWYLVLTPYPESRQRTCELIVPESVLRSVRNPFAVGYHPRLPVFFEGYDMKRGIYLPRKPLGEDTNNLKRLYV